MAEPQINFRFATEEDAPAFAKWVAENPQIDPKDKHTATKEVNPTTTYLVIEIDGVVRFFLPCYFTLRIGYCGFNPENSADDTRNALEAMLPYLKEFARHWKINEIDVLTRRQLPIAQWAAAHGFNRDARELFTLKVDPPSPKSNEGSVH